MDFSLSDDQEALRDLARKILADQVTQDRLKAAEEGGDWFDAQTWEALGAAGLLGIGIPEEHGGGGLGFLEIAIVAEELGAAVAPTPYLASVVGAALPIARFGTDEQRARWLPGAASGEAVLTVAVQEPQGDPAEPTVRAIPEGDAWRLSGTKHAVPALHLAQAVVVSARTDAGPGLFLVATQAGEELQVQRNVATDQQPMFTVTFDGAPAERLGDGGDLTWLLERLTAALCVTQAGVSERALRTTAEYVSTRHQFDHPLASFQAVSQRTADGYIDVEAIRLTAWQAAWRLSEDLPARDEVTIAKWWAAEAGSRVAHTAQHLHGGVGADVDYPIHRYFWWTKMIELALGGPSAQLRKLGASIAQS